MITKLFGVYDSKALAFLQPFFSVSNGAAIRAFEDVVRDGQSPISKHPGDYQLYELGQFDDRSGLVVAVVPTILLCNGSDFASPVLPPKSAVSSGIRLAQGSEVSDGS